MKKKILMAYAMFLTVAMAMIMSGCGGGKKVVTYNTEDYISVSVNGVDGEGRLSVETGTDEFLQKVNADLFEGKASDIDLASMLVNVAVYADYSVKGEKENLSNGDTVTITMSADNDSLRELGIEFALNDFSYTVSGLAEPMELDVWTGLEVIFEGISEKGKAEVVYNGNDDFVKSNVYYTLDKSRSLSNGDTVVVEANCSQSDLDNAFYVISEWEREFTVSGLPFYADSFDGFDISEFEEEIFTEAKTRADKSTWGKAYSDHTFLYGFQLNIEGVSPVWAVTDEYTIKPVKKVLYRKNTADEYFNNESNSYTIFYEITFPCVKEKGGFDDGYEQGDSYDLTLYLECHFTDIVIDGKPIESENSKIGGKIYSADVINDYMGLSLDEIVRQYEEEHGYSEWIKTEIK